MVKQRLHLTIFPNRYGAVARLLFDHEEGGREHYKLDFRDVYTVRTQRINPEENTDEYHSKFIDWDGGEGYHLGWEFAGWKLVDIYSITGKGNFMVFEPVEK